ncbi:MAG: hypothetical protein IPL96_07710 [Holophagaceae bacterium]|nr:hypothetical protein [Holophagaceae bacterium]
MSSCHPSTQRPLPALPVLHRNGLGVALDGALGLLGKTSRTTLAKPVPTPKRTLDANVIIKVHEVGAP